MTARPRADLWAPLAHRAGAHRAKPSRVRLVFHGLAYAAAVFTIGAATMAAIMLTRGML